jgi:phage host-nuclease inhibitor protein Gam
MTLIKHDDDQSLLIDPPLVSLGQGSYRRDYRPAQEQHQVFRHPGDRLEASALAAGNPEAEALEKYVRLTRRYSAEIDTVKQQMGALLRELENKLKCLDYRFGPVAQEYVRRKLSGAKAKSIKLPFGTAGFRTLPSRIELIDAAAVLAAVDKGELPAEVKRVPEPEVSKSALAEHFKTTGEVPPGTELLPARESFYIR